MAEASFSGAGAGKRNVSDDFSATKETKRKTRPRPAMRKLVEIRRNRGEEEAKWKERASERERESQPVAAGQLFRGESVLPACLPPAHPAAPRPPSAAVAAELRSEKEPQECFWKQ